MVSGSVFFCVVIDFRQPEKQQRWVEDPPYELQQRFGFFKHIFYGKAEMAE